MNQIKSACFRCEDLRVIEFAQGERTPSKWIAHSDKFSFAHDDERERSLNPPQRRKNISAIVRWLREQVENDFAVGSGLENGAFSLELVAQEIVINQFGVVGDLHRAENSSDLELSCVLALVG